jgi:hypothetical protein
MCVFQSESLLQGIQVFRVEDGRKGGTVDGAVCVHGVFPHIASVRYLFCQYYNFQTHKLKYLVLVIFLIVTFSTANLMKQFKARKNVAQKIINKSQFLVFWEENGTFSHIITFKLYML